MKLAEFASDVRQSLARHLAPAAVVFRGSIARGDQDEFSDIDIEAHVQTELDGEFFTRLEAFLVDRYGPALTRYDPDFASDLRTQDIRFSFRKLPIFWRLDLIVRSDRAADQKWPDPFPEWSAGTSALMNLIWALKYLHRQRPSVAQEHLVAAGEKLGRAPSAATPEAILELLDVLATHPDVDEPLRRRTYEAAGALAV